MTMLNDLRKNYDRLTGQERANMLLEASLNLDEELAAALAPSSLRAAYDVVFCSGHMTLMAAVALDSSRRAIIRGFLSIHERRQAEKDQRPIDEILALDDKFEEADRESRAWMLALAEVEKKTGAALVDAATLIGGPFVPRILESSKDDPPDFENEFETLYHLWEAWDTRH